MREEGVLFHAFGRCHGPKDGVESSGAQRSMVRDRQAMATGSAGLNLNSEEDMAPLSGTGFQPVSL